jgi:hypothetical protein
LSSFIVSGQIFPFVALVNATLSVELSVQEQDALQVWSKNKDVQRFIWELGELISAKDFISWSTWGHDAVDVKEKNWKRRFSDIVCF